MNKKKALKANLLLLLGLILFIAVPTLLTKLCYSLNIVNNNMTLIISGMSSILVLGGASLIYCALTKQSFTKAMHIRKISVKQIFLCVVIGLGAYICAIGINFISMSLIPVVVEDGIAMSQILNSGSFLVGLVVIVVIPAFFEEIFFRGIFLDGYDGINKRLRFFLVTLIFATFHGNLMQIIYVMFLGYVLVYVRDYTDSLLGAMIVHGANNGISFCISKLGVLLMTFINEASKNGVLDIPEIPDASANTGVSIVQALIGAPIFFLIGGTILFVALKSLKNHRDNDDFQEDYIMQEGYGLECFSDRYEKKPRKAHFIPLVVYFIAIISLVTLQYIL